MGKIKKSDNKKKPLVSKEIKGLALTFLFAIAVLVLAASLIRITKLGTVGRAYVPVTYKGSTINLSDYPFPFMEKSIVVLGDYVDSLSANILSSYLGVNIVNTPITSDEAAQNVVAVGHPCNNTIVDSFLSTVGMGCGDWNYIDGQAMIKLFQNGDNIALVVAGATSDDTRRAAMVIANYGSYNYGSYKFVGDEVCVTGTGLSLSDISVSNGACVIAIPPELPPAEPGVLIEQDIGDLIFVDARLTKEVCELVDKGECKMNEAEYEYPPGGVGRIYAAVETHTEAFTNDEAVAGFIAGFEGVYDRMGPDNWQGSNYYLFTQDIEPRDALLLWHSGTNVVAIKEEKWDTSQVDDEILEPLVEAYFAKYPSDLVFEEICTDTDGDNYSVKGNVTVNGNIAMDYCNSFAGICPVATGCCTEGVDCTHLVEWICDPAGYTEGAFHSDYYAPIFYECPNGCVDGACDVVTVAVPISCTESDGKDYFVQGNVSFAGYEFPDMCITPKYMEVTGIDANGTITSSSVISCDTPIPQKDALVGDCFIGGDDEIASCTGQDCYLKETFCGFGGTKEDAEYYNCPNGCSDGACVIAIPPVTCTDDDGGKDYFSKGTASGYDDTYGFYVEEDRCVTEPNTGELQLEELYCNPTIDNDIWAEHISCPSGYICQDGACIAAPTQFSIQLEPGWNLISIPLVLDNNSIEDVLADIKDDVIDVWAYDPEEEWKVKHFANPSTPSNLHTIELGRAYWIEMNNSATLSVEGVLFETTELAPPPSFALKQGWNMVGIYSLENRLMSYAFASIEGQYSTLWTYEAGELVKVFSKADPALAALDPELEAGKGYWIYMIQEGAIVP